MDAVTSLHSPVGCLTDVPSGAIDCEAIWGRADVENNLNRRRRSMGILRRHDAGLFVICLALFFVLNLAALASLQGFAIGSIPEDKRPPYLAEASTVLLLLHFTLDVAVLALVQDTMA
jgi:hypothetical protein